MFKRLEGDVALVLTAGVYKDAEVYEYRGALFIKSNGGYVRLYADGRTSKAGLSLKELHTEAPLYKDSFGRLSIQPGEKRKPLAEEAATQLLLGNEDL